ncbi:hypothetical protein MKW94_025022 [Papaver nudicaule]|uniref:60S acidic ribosomal protein P2 n=1 Tax=Papaver nudicaule TaxID=74823 RepID=A0AA41SFM9_PAPNU|nr:hypothetical protein [Papaver nudicaule]
MKVISAYLLAVLGGNKEPAFEDIKNILGSVGAADDSDERIQLLLSQLKGKDLNELIACGRNKLFVCVPVVVNAIGDGGAGPAGSVAEPKKEEKVEENIDEDSDDDWSDLYFGDPLREDW